LKQTSTQIIILAAGKGSRMNSEIPKVLHETNGKSLIHYVLSTSYSLNPNNIMIVVGFKSEMVKKAVSDDKIFFVEQKKQLGTGHAVMQCQRYINSESEILILYGDVPFITQSTLSKLILEHKKNDNDASILSSIVPNSRGYGRILRDESGNFLHIREEKDANNYEKEINEINTGICVFKGSILKKYISKINNNNNQNEFYLTDIFSLLLNSGNKIGVSELINYEEAIGINTQDELLEASIQNNK
tara:strand:- start:738 stop:1472 length:735 start_codon:yes stop_codon:yes gene_type:complete